MDASVGLSPQLRELILRGNTKFRPAELSAKEQYILVCRAVDAFQPVMRHLTGLFHLGNASDILDVLARGHFPSGSVVTGSPPPISVGQHLLVAVIRSSVSRFGAAQDGDSADYLLLSRDGVWGLVNIQLEVNFRAAATRRLRVSYQVLSAQDMTSLLGSDPGLLETIVIRLGTALEESIQQRDAYLASLRRIHGNLLAVTGLIDNSPAPEESSVREALPDPAPGAAAQN